jgi:hypothetical protein
VISWLAYRYQLFAADAPLNWISHIFPLAAESGFLLFKEQDSLKFKQEISVVQSERKTFRLISLSTPVSFLLDSPFKGIVA